MAQYEPKHLNRWTLPDSYAGAHWPEWFVFLGRHRESDLITESNFDCALAALGGESDTVRVIRESHWAVGWVEWIGIHESDAASLEKADSILAELAIYPILNEDEYSQREFDAACEYWESLSVRERAEYCAKSGDSIFAARRDWIPENTYQAIVEIVQ